MWRDYNNKIIFYGLYNSYSQGKPFSYNPWGRNDIYNNNIIRNNFYRTLVECFTVLMSNILHLLHFLSNRQKWHQRRVSFLIYLSLESGTLYMSNILHPWYLISNRTEVAEEILFWSSRESGTLYLPKKSFCINLKLKPRDYTDISNKNRSHSISASLSASQLQGIQLISLDIKFFNRCDD